MSSNDILARRGLLKNLVLGCAILCGTRLIPEALADVADPTARLALRLVATARCEPSVLLRSVPARGLAEIMDEVLGTAAREQLLQLDDAQLKQWLAARIEQDYRSGAMVRWQGWWLARSEAAIFELTRWSAHRMRV
jgi:hypothetical protein